MSTTQENPGIRQIWRTSMSALYRTVDSIDRGTAIIHRSVVLADEANELWAKETIARRQKEHDDAQALLEGDTTVVSDQ